MLKYLHVWRSCFFLNLYFISRWSRHLTQAIVHSRSQELSLMRKTHRRQQSKIRKFDAQEPVPAFWRTKQLAIRVFGSWTLTCIGPEVNPYFCTRTLHSLSDFLESKNLQCSLLIVVMSWLCNLALKRS